jgi:hypothetical protein
VHVRVAVDVAADLVGQVDAALGDAVVAPGRPGGDVLEAAADGAAAVRPGTAGCGCRFSTSAAAGCRPSARTAGTASACCTPCCTTSPRRELGGGHMTLVDLLYLITGRRESGLTVGCARVLECMLGCFYIEGDQRI